MPLKFAYDEFIAGLQQSKICSSFTLQETQQFICSMEVRRVSKERPIMCGFEKGVYCCEGQILVTKSRPLIVNGRFVRTNMRRGQEAI